MLPSCGAAPVPPYGPRFSGSHSPVPVALITLYGKLLAITSYPMLPQMPVF